MEEQRTRGGAIAAVLAIAALGVAAVPAYGALAGGSNESSAANTPGGTTVQDSQPRPDRRDDDCPFKDGDRGGGSGGDRGSGGADPQTAL
jgi:hypothetical protein